MLVEPSALGGAIFNQEGSMTINNSHFQDNDVSGSVERGWRNLQ